MKRAKWLGVTAWLAVVALIGCAAVERQRGRGVNAPPVRIDTPPAYMAAAKKALAEPFKGITTDGKIVVGLYSAGKTGVLTEPIRRAADDFIAALTEPQRAQALFPVTSNEWRNWSNIHRYPREGVMLGNMNAAQRDRALALMRATLSARGFGAARDVMKLNETIAELTGKFDEYGDDLYWFTVMGTPSATAPWGWQLDGHHLVINCFVLGDQVVMTPLFMGSEPTRADGGKYAGTVVFQEEERRALAFMRTLTFAQRAQAVVSESLPREIFAPAFRDNLELRYQGVRYADLSAAQQQGLLALIETHIGKMREGHDAVRMTEIKRHLQQTWFTWMGGTTDGSVFYYRIQSPVVMIEFDHQSGIALSNREPSRNHVHTVIRTPNGNDYGMDLLRQHHAQIEHVNGVHVARQR